MLAVVAANAADAQRLLNGDPLVRQRRRARSCAATCCRTGKPCPTTPSRRTRTWCRSAWRPCMKSATASATCCSCPPPPRCCAWRRRPSWPAYTFFFKQGEKLDEARLKAQLTLAGYTHVTQVMSPGEYSVRGGLIDLFPMGSALPYRLDLFGDEIETIRTFDADTQRSLYPVREVRLLPGREFPMDEAARTAFRSRWREVFEGDPSRSPIYKDIGNGIASAGIEYYLPLFFEQTATLFDYLPEDAPLALVGDIDARSSASGGHRSRATSFLKGDRERPLLAPQAPVPDRRGVLHPGQAVRRAGAAPATASSLRAVGADCPTSRSTGAPTTRWPTCAPICCRAGRRVHDLRRIATAGAKRCSSISASTTCALAPCEGFAGFPAARRQADARRGAAARRLRAGDRTRRIAFITETELYAGSRPPRRPQEAGRRDPGRSDGARPVGAEDRRSGGAHATTASAATWA